jgi:hypothetical protein
MRLFRRGVITVVDSVPPPTEREVLRALGIPHHQRIADVDESGVRDAILLAQRRARELTSFQGVFRTAEVARIDAEEVRVVDAPAGMLGAPTFVKRFAEAKEVAILAVTLGQTWDDVLDDLGRRGEAAEAWFLDALGTFFVDRASREIERRVAHDLARAGLGRIGRYRAGYGDVPLERQALFCDFVDARRIGIETTESMSLWPRKSVTTVVGFREGEDEDES